jgi:erythromycin esterase-like protein
MMKRLLAALALLAAAPTAAWAQPADPAMDATVRDLCHRQVAMLGEASHGDGATFAFKAALIRRLVDECGYNAVFFEASHYDFLEFSRRRAAREPVTPAMISSSIGGMWNRFAELTPLIRFLFDRAQTGRLQLGGLDDQVGSAGAFFSNDEMPLRLTAGLSPDRREACRALLHRRFYWQYGDAVHHDAAELGRIQTCLAEMAAAVARSAPARERSMQLQMVASMQRALSRDFFEANDLTRGRDRSMYLNLRWLAARIGPRAKIIIWAHNAHIARDARTSSSFPEGGNLGAWVDRFYGRRAFALGFSAYGGSWRSVFSREEAALPPAPPGSLEALAMTGVAGDTVYRGPAWLARVRSVPGRPFHYHYAPADWGRVFDGLLVFRAERAPTRNPS